MTHDSERDRFVVACRLLRLRARLNVVLPGQKKGESPIDWMVRHKLAVDARHAAYALIEGAGMTEELNFTLRMLQELEAENQKQHNSCLDADAPDGA
jgi:hypothetical protein